MAENEPKNCGDPNYEWMPASKLLRDCLEKIFLFGRRKRRMSQISTAVEN